MDKNIQGNFMAMPLSKPGLAQIEKEGHYVLYNDTGVSLINLDYPKSINVGISECTMVGMACGLASEGHKVYCFAVTPHFLRAWEFVRTLLVPRNYNVIICGMGEGEDFASLGHSHQMGWEEMELHCRAAKIEYRKPITFDGFQQLLSMRGPLFIQIPKRILA